MYEEQQQSQLMNEDPHMIDYGTLDSPGSKKNNKNSINRFNDRQQQKCSEEKCSTYTIIHSLRDENLHHKNFKSCWNQFIAKVNPHVQFSNYLPVALSELGLQLISNSDFILHWLQLMKMCPFMCFSIILRHTAKAHPKCFQNSQQLQRIWFATFSVQQNQSKNKKKDCIQQSENLKRNDQNIENTYPPIFYKKQQRYQNGYEEVTSSQMPTQLF